MNGATLGSARPLRRAAIPTQAAMVLAGVAILTASAKFQVPFWPAPMTMQTLAVLTLGAAYGARLGSGTVIAYLALGAAGAPVFAAGGAPPISSVRPAASSSDFRWRRSSSDP